MEKFEWKNFVSGEIVVSEKVCKRKVYERESSWRDKVFVSGNLSGEKVLWRINIYEWHEVSLWRVNAPTKSFARGSLLTDKYLQLKVCEWRKFTATKSSATNKYCEWKNFTKVKLATEKSLGEVQLKIFVTGETLRLKYSWRRKFTNEESFVSEKFCPDKSSRPINILRLKVYNE